MRLLFFILLLCTATCCEKTSVRGVDLIGNWRLSNHADPDIISKVIFEFEPNSNLIIHSGDYSDTLEYKLLFNNSIHIIYETIDDIFDINTYTKDSIEIMGFSLSSVPEEYNTLLVRL